MADLADLERRIRVLEEECRKVRDIEEIKQLKHRYWRSIREKQWNETADCFTEDALLEVPGQELHHGKDSIFRVYRFMARYFSIVAPQGHNSEIEITSETTARGTWFNDNVMVEAETGVAGRAGVLYKDEYAKEKGEWKMKSCRATFFFKQSVNMDEVTGA